MSVNLSIKEIISTSRPFSWINTAAPFIVGYLIAAKTFDLGAALGLMYFLFFYNFLMYGVNDIYDYESDLKNPRKNSIEGGLVDKNKHKAMFYSIIVLNMPFVIFFLATGNLLSNVTLLLIIFFSLSYSAKPFRFKEIPILDSINSSLHFVLPLVFGYLYAGSVDLPWPAIIAFFFWGAASQALGAIQDIQPDRSANIHSIATKLGSSATNTYSLVLYALTCLVVGLSYSIWGLVASLILLPYAINTYIFRKYKSDAKSGEYRRAWKNFMWLNLLCGFWLAQLLIFVFNPANLGRNMIYVFSSFLVLIGITQTIITIKNYLDLKRPKSKRLSELPNIDIVIHPISAKENVSSVLLALMGQNYPHFNVYLPKENIQNKEIAQNFQDPRIKLINTGKRPKDWHNDSWISQKLFESTNSDIILLINSDAILMPNTLSVIASIFESSKHDLISLLPADQGKSISQKIISSQLLYFLFCFFPINFISKKYPQLTPAPQSVIAFKRSSLNSIGSFKSTKSSTLGDSYIIKSAATNNLDTATFNFSDLIIGQDKLSFKEIYKLDRSILYPHMNYNLVLNLAIASGGLFINVLPFVLVFVLFLAGSYASDIFALTFACLILFVPRAIVGIKSKQSLASIILFPLGSFVVLISSILSMLYYELKKPRWKNRNEI